MAEALFLNRNDVEQVLHPGEIIDAVREGYRQRGHGAAAEPRTKLTNDNPPGILTGYLAILPEDGVMGGYVYSGGFSAGDAWFFTPLFDAESGEPIALLDGVNMNPFKTGATGAVAVDVLARDDVNVLAVLGSGPQAAGQLQATTRVRSFETVRVFSPTENHRRSFAEEFDEKLEPIVKAVKSSTRAVEGADVVITATDSSTPVFESSDLSPGTHVTAMGQYDTTAREIDSETVRRSTYVLDLKDRAHQDAGAFIEARNDGLIDESHIHAELGDIVAGTRPGRQSRDEITLFDSGGTAIETTAAAYDIYRRAREKDLGQTIQLSPASDALTGRLKG
ncbi:MAG: ornithine cyclodeaminase family protein [bacterium]